MECKKIEDMMQLYVEDLCSVESKQWIEDHVKGCPACKKRLERLQQEKRQEFEQDGKRQVQKTMDEDALKKELTPFRKLRRKLWFRCVLDVAAILAVVLLFVCAGIFGVTVWSKVENYVENYALEKYGKETVSYLVDGEIDQFLSAFDCEGLVLDLVSGRKEFIQDCKEDITGFYETELKGETVETSVKVEKYFSYEETYSGRSVMATIKTSGKEFCMELMENAGVLCFGQIYEIGKEQQEISQFDKLTVLSVASYDTGNLIPQMEQLDEQYAEKEEAPLIFALGLVNAYDDNAQAKASWEKLRELMADGISIERSGCSGLHYDTESGELYTTLMWKLQDTDGGCAYLEKEIRVPNLKSRDSDMVVISEGFSQEKVKKLKEIFD